MNVKRIEITNRAYFDHVIINQLETKMNCVDEYETWADINFMLKEDNIGRFSIFEEPFYVFGVKLYLDGPYGEELNLAYLCERYNGDVRTLRSLPINYELAKEIHNILVDEEKKVAKGWLNNHVFSDQIDIS